MSPSRRFHLLLPSDLEDRLRHLAASRGVPLAVALRELASQGLASADGLPDFRGAESPVLLATLMAAEHAVLMVASVLPEGEGRMRSLAARAVEAAEERLALFREPAGAEEAPQ